MYILSETLVSESAAVPKEALGEFPAPRRPPFCPAPSEICDLSLQ